MVVKALFRGHILRVRDGRALDHLLPLRISYRRGLWPSLDICILIIDHKLWLARDLVDLVSELLDLFSFVILIALLHHKSLSCLIALLINIELESKSESWLQPKWIQQEEQHIVKLDVEWLTLIVSLCEVLHDQPTQEVYKLWIRQLEHLLSVPYSVDQSAH